MPAAGDVGRRCGEVAEWSSSESLPCVGEDPCRRGSAGLGEADGWEWALEPVLNGREFQGHPTVPLGRPIELATSTLGLSWSEKDWLPRGIEPHFHPPTGGQRGGVLPRTAYPPVGAR